LTLNAAAPPAAGKLEGGASKLTAHLDTGEGVVKV
jgi:hypothetical protein